MILGFKPQFVEPILQGKKIHTIRAGNRWKIGNKIHFATGVRTKNYNCFKEGIVKGIQDISFCVENYNKKFEYRIFIDGKLFSGDIEELSNHDGFSNLFEFIDFFRDELPFKGQLIHWTDFKY